MNKNQEKILKKIISESSTPGYENRKFGDSLPTLASVQKAYGEKLNEATKPIDKQLVSQWEKMCTFLQRKMDEFKKTIPKSDPKHGMANGAYNYLNSVKPIAGQWLKIEKTLTEAAGVKHYTKDGKEWTGATHKMPNGTLMTQDPHNKDSEELFHKEDLAEAAPKMKVYSWEKHFNAGQKELDKAANIMSMKSSGGYNNVKKDVMKVQKALNMLRSKMKSNSTEF